MQPAVARLCAVIKRKKGDQIVGHMLASSNKDGNNPDLLNLAREMAKHDDNSSVN
jgi:hypothetical protein